MRNRFIGQVAETINGALQVPAWLTVHESSILPVAAWRLDETSGTMAADAVGDRDGTHGPGVTVGETGQVSIAALYEATADAQTTIGDELDFTGAEPLSIAAWVNVDALLGEALIAQKYTGNEGYRFRVVGGKLRFSIWSDESSSAGLDVETTASEIAPGEWLHVAVTYVGTDMVQDAGDITLYVNGAAVGVTIVENSISGSAGNAADLELGGQAANNYLLDDIAIFDRELRPSEVVAISLAGAEGVSVADGVAPVYRAAQGAITELGFFSLRIAFRVFYEQDAVDTIHTLLAIGAGCRVFFRASDAKVVLEVDGYELASAALEFPPGTTLTVDVEHTEERRRLRVRGADVGDGLFDAAPRPATEIESMIYVLGTQDGAEEAAELVSLRPLNATTFAQLASDRLLAQSDGDEVLEALVAALAAEPAVSHDTALMLRDSYDLDHAVGAQQDTVGSIVGLRREGYEDDRYRDFLKIQVELILAQARDDGEWTGTAPNIIRIVRTFVGPDAPQVIYTSSPPYSYTVNVEGLDITEAPLLVRFLRTATYAGVLGLVEVGVGEESVMGSAAVTITGEGIMGSASVTVTGAMDMDTVLEVS